MKTLCLALMMAVLPLCALAEEGDTLWSRTYGGGGDWDEFYGIVPTSDGCFLLAGITNSFGAGPSDMYLVKINGQGDTLWTRTYGGYDYDGAYSIVPSSDGKFLISGYTYGFFYQNTFCVLIDSAGTQLWSQIFPMDEMDYANAAISVEPNGFLVAGQNNYQGNAGDGFAYLLHINNHGETRALNFGGPLRTEAKGLVETNDGNILVAGYSYNGPNSDVYLFKVTRHGYQLWARYYGGWYIDKANSIIPTEDGNFLVGGQTSSFGLGYFDMYLIKIDTDGDTLWSRTYGGVWTDIMNCIVPAENDNYLLVGNTDSFGVDQIGIYLVKVNPHGTTEWNTVIDDGCIANAGIQTSDGDYLIVGARSVNNSAYEWDAYLVKIQGARSDDDKIQTNQKKACLQIASSPNPFNPISTISYRLSEDALVSLVVYDLMGKSVATLVDGWQELGEHSVFFNGSHCASGLYFYRFTAGEQVFTGKLLLQK